MTPEHARTHTPCASLKMFFLLQNGGTGYNKMRQRRHHTDTHTDRQSSACRQASTLQCRLCGTTPPSQWFRQFFRAFCSLWGSQTAGEHQRQGRRNAVPAHSQPANTLGPRKQISPRPLQGVPLVLLSPPCAVSVLMYLRPETQPQQHWATLNQPPIRRLEPGRALTPFLARRTASFRRQRRAGRRGRWSNPTHR